MKVCQNCNHRGMLKPCFCVKAGRYVARKQEACEHWRQNPRCPKQKEPAEVKRG